MVALREPVQADPTPAKGSWLTVKRGDFEEVCSEEGELRAAKVTTITFSDWAHLKWIVPDGTRVKKGDKVAAQDTEDWEDDFGEDKDELAEAERDLAQTKQSFELTKKKFSGEMESVKAKFELAKLKEQELLAKPLPLEREEAANLLLSAQARLEAAKADLDAMRPLFEQGFGQRADLEDKELAYETATVELENARLKAKRILDGATEIERGMAAQERRAAEIALRIKELERERALTDLQAKIVRGRSRIKRYKQRIVRHEKKLADSVRYAPHDGIVVHREVGHRRQRKVEVGSWVGPWSSPLDIPNYEYMKVRTQVPESVVNRFVARRGPPDPREGSSVRVRVKTLPDRDYAAEVTWIDGWARDRNAHLSEADIRTVGYSGLRVFNVEVRLLESDTTRLREGFRAIVDFPIQIHKNVISLPRDAISIRHGQPTVTVREGSQTVTRPVVLGPESRNHVIVKEGLSDGEQVFVPPSVDKTKTLAPPAGDSGEKTDTPKKKAPSGKQDSTKSMQRRRSGSPAGKPSRKGGGGRGGRS